MNPDVFSTGDSVLLVGEGNFSFAVCLVNLNLPITITASCLNPANFNSSKENIEYLKQRGVRVFQDVDATKLNNHPVIKNEKFSKIIFNFPHIGGKMKIHLNRALLKEFFQSSSEIVSSQGKILVTLCKGQGGTRVDRPVRPWDDTWQIVEMAAHGNFVLISVEEFRSDLYPDYIRVGYRSGESAFHTEGALVHIFKRTQPFFENMDVDALSRCLEKQILRTTFGNVICSEIYSSMYKDNPLVRTESAAYFLCEQLKAFVKRYETASLKIRTILDDDIPIFSGIPTGGPVCYSQKHKKECSLRNSLIDCVGEILKVWEKDKETVIFPGIVFNKLGADFSFPPLSCQILILGKKSLDITVDFLKKMFEIFHKDSLCLTILNVENNAEFNHEAKRNVCVIQSGNSDNILSATQSLVAQEFISIGDCEGVLACVIYIDKLVEVLFNTDNWRQLWAKQSCVVFDKNIPILKYSCFESRIYVFDISFTESPSFSLDKFYYLLWHLAGDIISSVEFLSKYESSDGLKKSVLQTNLPFL